MNRKPTRGEEDRQLIADGEATPDGRLTELGIALRLNAFHPRDRAYVASMLRMTPRERERFEAFEDRNPGWRVRQDDRNRKRDERRFRTEAFPEIGEIPTATMRWFHRAMVDDSDGRSHWANYVELHDEIVATINAARPPERLRTLASQSDWNVRHAAVRVVDDMLASFVATHDIGGGNPWDIVATLQRATASLEATRRTLLSGCAAPATIEAPPALEQLTANARAIFGVGGACENTFLPPPPATRGKDKVPRRRRPPVEAAHRPKETRTEKRERRNEERAKRVFRYVKAHPGRSGDAIRRALNLGKTECWKALDALERHTPARIEKARTACGYAYFAKE